MSEELSRSRGSIMTLNRISVVAALAAGALAWAAPAAAADAGVFGTYAFSADDGETATWTLSPCADDAPGCVHVAETGNAKRAPWSGDAHWSVGSLILFVQQPDAILCMDGSSSPGRNTYSWDGASMSGSASIISNGACGVKSESLSIPFKLTRIGAAEAPQPPVPAAPAPAAPAVPQGMAAAPAAPPAPVEPLAAESTATGPAVPPAPAAPAPAPAA
jgi:hypothetical protein